MGMVVRTNTMAVNANRQLSSNNTQVGKSLEKLSSGFRINRAGDDASGLAISEKMKAQIKGLEQASSNSQDGISLIQTAEGNLTEVHDMLNRMVELAEKSANGILEDTDRSAVQDEMDALAQEIDRIADSANFNNIKLFDGSLGGGGITATSAKGSAGVSTFDDGATAVAAVKAAFENISVTGADDGNVTLTRTGTGVAAKGETTGVTIAGLTAAKFSTGDSTGVLNTKTVAIATDATVDTHKAEIASDGTITITLGSKTNGFATKADLENAINGALAAATKAAGSTASDAIVNSWKGVTVDLGTAGTFAPVAAAGSVTLAATALTGGDDGKIAYTLTDAGGNTATATVDGATANNGDAVNFTGDFTASMKIKDKTAATLAAANGVVGALATAPSAGKTELDFTGLTGKDVLGTTIAYGGNTYEFVENADDVKGTNTAIVVTKASTDTAIAGLVQAALNGHPAQTDGANNDTVATANNADGDTTIVRVSNNTTGAASAAPDVKVGGGKSLKLQIGDTNDDYNKLQVSMKDMHMSALFDATALTDADYNGTLGIGTAVLKDVGSTKSLDVSEQDKAGAALKSIRKVIDTVSTQRGKLGALQNRLEHTINNLDVTNENMTAANSRIRDTDMAKEMMNYTKMNVLVQSAQAMLAQANQQPQSILQLLQ